MKWERRHLGQESTTSKWVRFEQVEKMGTSARWPTPTWFKLGAPCNPSVGPIGLQFYPHYIPKRIIGTRLFSDKCHVSFVPDGLSQLRMDPLAYWEVECFVFIG